MKYQIFVEGELLKEFGDEVGQAIFGTITHGGRLEVTSGSTATVVRDDLHGELKVDADLGSSKALRDHLISLVTDYGSDYIYYHSGDREEAVRRARRVARKGIKHV